MSSAAVTTMIDGIPATVLDEAIAWQVRLRSGTTDQATVAACGHWRQRDPLHERCWQALLSAERPFEQALGIAPTILRSSLANMDPRGTAHSRRRALRLLGLGALTSTVGLVASRTPSLRPDHATGLGRSLQLTLADGSGLTLNTRTAIDVDDPLRITLHRGELYLQTPATQRLSQPTTPVIIEAADHRLGTQYARFGLRRHSSGALQLNVETGRIQVWHESRLIGTTAAGARSYRIDTNGLQERANDGLDPLAWRQGTMVANRARLAACIGELARYRSGWLVCDPRIADLQVSGVFQLRDISGVLQALVRTLPIKTRQRWPYWTEVIPA